MAFRSIRYSQARYSYVVAQLEVSEQIETSLARPEISGNEGREEFTERQEFWSNLRETAEKYITTNEEKDTLTEIGRESIANLIAAQIASQMPPGTTFSTTVSFDSQGSVSNITARLPGGDSVAVPDGVTVRMTTASEQCLANPPPVPDSVEVDSQGKSFCVWIDKPSDSPEQEDPQVQEDRDNDEVEKPGDAEFAPPDDTFEDGGGDDDDDWDWDEDV